MATAGTTRGTRCVLAAGLAAFAFCVGSGCPDRAPEAAVDCSCCNLLSPIPGDERYQAYLDCLAQGGGCAPECARPPAGPPTGPPRGR